MVLLTYDEMKVENVIDVDVGDEVAVLGLVGHVDHIFALERYFVAVLYSSIYPNQHFSKKLDRF